MIQEKASLGKRHDKCKLTISICVYDISFYECFTNSCRFLKTFNVLCIYLSCSRFFCLFVKIKPTFKNLIVIHTKLLLIFREASAKMNLTKHCNSHEMLQSLITVIAVQNYIIKISLNKNGNGIMKSNYSLDDLLENQIFPSACYMQTGRLTNKIINMLRSGS